MGKRTQEAGSEQKQDVKGRLKVDETMIPNLAVSESPPCDHTASSVPLGTPVLACVAELFEVPCYLAAQRQVH